jgi:hypothetical protein
MEDGEGLVRRPDGRWLKLVLLVLACISCTLGFASVAEASGPPVCDEGIQNEQEPNNREAQATGPLCTSDKARSDSSAWVEGQLAGSPSDGDFGPGEKSDVFFVYIPQPVTLTVFLGVVADRTSCASGCDPVSLSVYDVTGAYSHSVEYKENGMRFNFALPAAGKYFLDLSGDGEDFVTYNLITTPGAALSDVAPPPPLTYKGRVKGSGPMSIVTDSSGSLLTSFIAILNFRCADDYRFSARYRFSRPAPIRNGGVFKLTARVRDPSTLGGRFEISGRVTGKSASGKIRGTEHLREHGRCTNHVGWSARLRH